jgi:CBS domain-containing protein
MGMAVEKIMVKSVVELDETESVGAARQLMENCDISALPVVDAEGTLVGIVTASDLVIDYDDILPVSRIMTSPLHTLEPGADVSEAAHLMRKHGHHHVMILDEGRIVGILSSLDLLQVIELEAVVE